MHHSSSSNDFSWNEMGQEKRSHLKNDTQPKLPRYAIVNCLPLVRNIVRHNISPLQTNVIVERDER